MKQTWHPSASIENLRLRAQIFKTIRDFLAAKNILEVETPLLCHTSVTDTFIESIPAYFQSQASAKAQTYYLQTSPEYAMKRLLAAGSGAIYQITKAFRQGEVGRIHNPEFSMLEWYRPDFDHHQLMDEVDALLQLILNTSPAERTSYTDLFQQFLKINVHNATVEELNAVAKKHEIIIIGNIHDKDTWLNLLMTHCIEPKLGMERPCFIYDFPASQAALARIQATTPPLAARFEVYCHGMELANGFHELQDANEQRKRFEKNIAERLSLGLKTLPIDELFLAALSHGLPNCAGVALGLDRLLMLATKSDAIAEVLSFDFARV